MGTGGQVISCSPWCSTVFRDLNTCHFRASLKLFIAERRVKALQPTSELGQFASDSPQGTADV